MLSGSLYETLPWVTPFRLKINAAFLYVVQVAAARQSGCKAHGPSCRGNGSSGKFVTGMGLSPAVPLQQRGRSTPAWWPSPSCCVCSLGWQQAGKTKVWCKVIGSACRPAAGHTAKALADTEKPGSWEAAASTAHDFSSPAENGGAVNKCQPSCGSAWVWRATRHCREEGNVLEAPVSLHDSARSGSQRRGLAWAARMSHSSPSRIGKQVYAPASTDQALPGLGAAPGTCGGAELSPSSWLSWACQSR